MASGSQDDRERRERAERSGSTGMISRAALRLARLFPRRRIKAGEEDSVYYFILLHGIALAVKYPTFARALLENEGAYTEEEKQDSADYIYKAMTGEDT